MPNYTASMESLTGNIGDPIGLVTITLIPDEGYSLVSTDFSVTNASDFETAPVISQDGTNVTVAVDYPGNFTADMEIDVQIDGDARPLEPRVYGDCTFIDDANINFTVRDADGNAVESQVLSIDVIGPYVPQTTDPITSELVTNDAFHIAGEVDVDRADGVPQEEPTISFTNSILSLVNPVENESGGYTYSVRVILPIQDTDITHTFDNGGIAVGAATPDDVDCLEIRTIDVDSGDLDPTAGGIVIVTVKGDPGAAGELTLTPTVSGANSQNIFIDPATSEPITISVSVLIGDQGIFVSNVDVPGPTSTTDALGNACQPQVPDDVDGVSWETNFDPADDNCFVGLMPEDIEQDEGTVVCFQTATSDGTFEANNLLGPSMRGSTFEGGVVEHTFSSSGWNLTGLPLVDGVYNLDHVNDIKLSEGTDTGTVFCNGTATVTDSTGEELLTSQTFDGADVFTLTNTPTRIDSITIDGTLLPESSYALTASTVAISPVPITGEVVVINYFYETGVVSNGLLTVRVEYTEGRFQDEDTKYIICIDNFAMIDGDTITVNFSESSDNFSTSQTGYSFVVPNTETLEADGGLTPNFVLITAADGYTWQDSDIAVTNNTSNPLIATQVLTVEGTGAVVAGFPDSSLDDADALTGDTEIRILRFTWTFAEVDPSGNETITFTFNGEPNKVVTTSFNTGPDGAGQGTIFDSTFEPIDSITNVAGRSYSTEYFVVPRNGHVFNIHTDDDNFTSDINTVTAETPSGATDVNIPTTLTAIPLVDGNSEDINNRPRYSRLRGVIEGNHHASEDTTVYLNGDGTAKRVVNVNYTLSNNSTNTTVSFVDTIRAVEDDVITGKTLTVAPIDTHEFTGTTSTGNRPSLTINGVDTDFDSAFVHNLGDLPVLDDDHTIHAVVGGDPTIKPVTVNVTFDTSGLTGVGTITPPDPYPLEIQAKQFRLQARLLLEMGYALNSANNIVFSYPNGIVANGSSTLSSGEWSQGSTLTIPNSAPGSTVDLVITVTQVSLPTLLVSLNVTGDTSFPAAGGPQNFTVTVDPGTYDPPTLSNTTGWSVSRSGNTITVTADR